jgi:hypothetical protein
MGGIVPVVNIEGLKPGDLVLDGPVKSGQGSPFDPARRLLVPERALSVDKS